MQKNTRWTRWILILLILFSPAEGYSADSPGNKILQDVTSDVGENGVTIRFEFSKPVLNAGEPVFNDKFVQLDIPQASVQPTKRFFYTGDTRIPQIVASRLDPKTLRVQFVLGGKFPLLKENFQIEDQGRSLVVHFFKKEEDVLSEFLARAANRMDFTERQAEAEILVPEEEPISSDPADSAKPLAVENRNSFLLEQVANKSIATEVPATPPPLRIDEGRSLNEPLDPVAITIRTFSMFALVLAFMFLIFYIFKKYVLKNTIFGGNEKFVQVLGSGFLGPKKSIVMVEVAGEVLVLGVSNDNISFLTRIQDKEKIEEIKASKKDVSRGKFWSSHKENNSAQNGDIGKSRVEGDFANYLSKYSEVPTEKKKTVEDVTELIRKSHGKLKIS